MHELYTEIEIQAPAAEVWRHLTDFQSFPDWNPLLVAVAGEVLAGATVSACASMTLLKRIEFFPRILSVETGREFSWKGHLLTPRLFAGVHFFIIVPLAPGRVRFIQRETYSGLLAPILSGVIVKLVRRNFIAMNEALKKRVEAEVAPRP